MQEKARKGTHKEILWMLGQKCCANNCNRKLSVDDVMQAETRLHDKNTNEIRQWIINFIQDHSKVIEKGEGTEKLVTVCRKMWLSAYNIKQDRYRRIGNAYFKDKVRNVVHGNVGRRKSSVPTADCVAWLQFFFDAIGNYQPDSKMVHLPSVFTKSKVYKKMKDENDSQSVETVSSSQFYKIWEDKFSHVTIPKVSAQSCYFCICSP